MTSSALHLVFGTRLSHQGGPPQLTPPQNLPQVCACRGPSTVRVNFTISLTFLLWSLTPKALQRPLPYKSYSLPPLLSLSVLGGGREQGRFGAGARDCHLRRSALAQTGGEPCAYQPSEKPGRLRQTGVCIQHQESAVARNKSDVRERDVEAGP